MNSFRTLNSSDFCYTKNAANFKYSAEICNAYPINTDCGLIAEDEQMNCELCKNSKLAFNYVQLNQGNGKNLSDMKEQYQRTWYQTGNLGVGILFLLNMASIGEYREFINQLIALDASLNLFDGCTTTLTNTGVINFDSDNGNYYMVNPTAAYCTTTKSGVTILYTELKTQVDNAIQDLSGTIITLNNNINNTQYTKTHSDITRLKQMYDSVINKRNTLDSKMQDLYAASKYETDEQMQMDSAVYGALLWTVFATSLLYYIFVKL